MLSDAYDWILRQQPRNLYKYSNQFIAVRKNVVVGHSTNLDTLKSNIMKKHPKCDDILIAYIDDKAHPSVV